MQVAFFGSSLVSSYWNGAATYYRGILRALDGLGYRVTFYEPDAYGRQQHRDLPEDPDWAKVHVYGSDSTDGVYRALELAQKADWIVKASGVGIFDELLEREVARMKPAGGAIFWDVDAPATLERVEHNCTDPFRCLIPRYDLVLTYGGGEPVVSGYRALGAKACIPIYNALDPETHFPEPARPEFQADLSFLGNRLPDREARVEEFFFQAARRLPERSFLLGGNGWDDKSRPGNVSYLGHVPTTDHNAVNSSARAVLNISRDSMARYGFSPATRVFEAAGASACLITDAWKGVEMFFEPGSEILVAGSGAEVADIVDSLSSERAREIGAAAYRRALAQHTYRQRALEVDGILAGRLMLGVG